MAVDPRTDVPDEATIRAVWMGVLVPPAAFLLNLEAAYALVPTACSTGSVLLVHLVHLISLAFVFFAGVVALRVWQRSGATWPGGEGGRIGRTRFLSGIGILNSVLFALVILAQWIPSFILDPCQ